MPADPKGEKRPADRHGRAIRGLEASSNVASARRTGVRKGRCTMARRAVAADQGPPVQPNKASSTDERLPDLRAIVAATTLQSRARESLLASLARRQASA
jgi:hypothetical protein